MNQPSTLRSTLHSVHPAVACVCAAVAIGALAACSSRGHELAAATACQDVAAAGGEYATARMRGVGPPYIGVEYADQELALNARPVDAAPQTF